MLEKMARLIDEREMGQGELESLAGLPKNRISKWNGGQGEPTAQQALRIARVLGVPLAYLVDAGIDEPAASAPHLSDAEMQAVKLTRALGLDETEVIRRLSTPAVATNGKAAPTTGPTYATSPDRPTRGQVKRAQKERGRKGAG